MKKKHSAVLSTIIVLLSIALVCGAGWVLWQVLPQKPAGSVSTIDTSGVFTSSSTVEPSRQPAYSGDQSVPQAASASSSSSASSSAAASSQTAAPAAASDADDSAQKAKALMNTMTLEEKVYQLFYVTPEILTGKDPVTLAGDSTKASIGTAPVGGMIYFSQNLLDREQVLNLLNNTQSYSKISLFLGVDEEGGVVSRIGSNAKLGGTKIDSMASYGQKGDPKALYAAGTAIAKELTGLGFNMDFAPVADVAESANAVIGTRSFGTDPKLCASLASVMVKSLAAGKVVSCLKHFPGYGSASGDDHNGSASISKTLEELEACDFVPFQSGIADGAPFVLVSHLSAPQVTGDDTPSDLSSKIVTEILRNKLGFTGVIITDSHQMASITDHYTPAEAAVKALQAGVDMVLMPNDLKAAADGVLAAVKAGTLTEDRINESVLRILTVKYQSGIIK
jgi:beta-N-acetylhexosaminidase